MIPLIKRLIRSFLFDEGAVTGWIRGAMLMFAASGIAFADQIAAVIDMPTSVKTIKLAAVICGFFAGAIRAGEKNITTQEPGKVIDVGDDNKVETVKTPLKEEPSAPAS